MNLEIRKKNRLALGLVLVGILLTIIILSLPIYTFKAGAYVEKSPDTFVGDETYKKVKAEVEAVTAEYESQGIESEIVEDVIERTNSKGQKTSLVIFIIEQTKGRSMWGFLGSGLASGYVLIGILLCAILALLFAVLGIRGTEDTLYKNLDDKARRYRNLAMSFSVIGFFLIPALSMVNKVLFVRRRELYLDGHLIEGKEEYFASLDKYLFDGTGGNNIESMVRELDIHQSDMFYMLFCTFALIALGTILIRYGALKNTLLRILMYVFIIAVCIVTIYPYFVMLITGLRTNNETLDMYFLHILPAEWVWKNLVDILHRGVARYLGNSLMIAGGATAIAMLCGIPAAYALARMNFRGKNAFLGFVIVSQMFAPVVLLIGISQLMNTLHLNNTIVGLMLINAAFNQAFAIWLLRGTFIAISPEMEEASLIDGCGTVSALTKVLAPMAAPGIVTALIFVFINAWNEYTVSTVLISTAEYRPITVGITQFSSFNMIEWQYLFAASLLATIPVVILFMSIEKHLTAGLTSGGVKG